jgi:hypothetical protein
MTRPTSSDGTVELIDIGYGTGPRACLDSQH